MSICSRKQNIYSSNALKLICELVNALHFVARKVGKTNHTIGNTNKWNGHNKTLREKLKYVEKMCANENKEINTQYTNTILCSVLKATNARQSCKEGECNRVVWVELLVFRSHANRHGVINARSYPFSLHAFFERDIRWKWQRFDFMGVKSEIFPSALSG